MTLQIKGLRSVLPNHGSNLATNPRRTFRAPFFLLLFALIRLAQSEPQDISLNHSLPAADSIDCPKIQELQIPNGRLSSQVRNGSHEIVAICKSGFGIRIRKHRGHPRQKLRLKCDGDNLLSRSRLPKCVRTKLSSPATSSASRSPRSVSSANELLSKILRNGKSRRRSLRRRNGGGNGVNNVNNKQKIGLKREQN